ncbi:MAG: hypothetical protein Q9P01_21660 [Anaerolineae bacterium]|nr:hypothetical protein [Anaerolineae bacterium]
MAVFVLMALMCGIVTQSSLRSQIGIVPQETLLFGGTIRENILLWTLGC